MKLHISLVARAGVACLAAATLVACGGAPEEAAPEAAPVETAAPAVDAGIRNVSRLHYNVADMDRAVAWYQGVLGMETISDNGGPSPTPIVPEEGAMMHTHIIETPGGEFSMELVEVSGVPVEPQEPQIQDPGAIMLAMQVSDLDAVLASARDLGLEVLSDGGDVVVTEDRGRQVMVRDDDGIVSYLTQSTEPDAASVAMDFTFMTVADLAQTVDFYNGVFGLGMAAPGDLGPNSARIMALTGNPALTMFRLTTDNVFAGTDGEMRFQQFEGAAKTAVHHRVQDPGGPILTMNVTDFAGVMDRVPMYGGMIGDGEASATLAPDATVSWIRDPNGLLIRVSQAQPPQEN